MSDLDPKSLEIALKALAKKDRTRAEISRSLTENHFSQAQIKATLDILESWGYVNDERLALRESEDKLVRKKLGKLKVYDDLLRRGIEEPVVQLLVAQISPEQQFDSAMMLCRNKYKPEDQPQKAGRFLYSRGYEADTITAVLEAYFPEFEN